MKKILKVVGFAVLTGAISFLTGCVLADKAMGVDPANPDAASGGIVGGIATLLGGLPGILGTLGTLLGGGVAAYQTYRKRQLGVANVKYDEAVYTLVAAIDQMFEQGTKLTVTKEEAYAVLEAMKTKLMSDPEFLTNLVATFKARLRAV